MTIDKLSKLIQLTQNLRKVGKLTIQTQHEDRIVNFFLLWTTDNLLEMSTRKKENSLWHKKDTNKIIAA